MRRSQILSKTSSSIESWVGSRTCLSNGFWLPILLELHEEEVIPQLRLGDGSRVAGEVLVDQPELPIIRMAGAIGVVAQRQVIREAPH